MMSLIDELVFTLAISLIVAAIIIRLLSKAADAASPKNPPSAVVIEQSSPSPAEEPASAEGESQPNQSASPAVFRLLEQADFLATLITQPKKGAIFASPVEKHDPGVVYRELSPGSARDCTSEETKGAELGESAARESGNLDYFGRSEVGSSRDAAIGSLSPPEEDKAAVVTEAAAARVQLIPLLSPKRVGHIMFDESSERNDIKIEEARSNSDYDFVEYSERDNINIEDEPRSKSDSDDLVESSKRDSINIEDEPMSKPDNDLVEYQLFDETSKRDTQEAKSKSDEDLTEYQVFDESSKRESINITESESESDDLVEERGDSRQDLETLEEFKVLGTGDAGEVSEELGHNVSEEEEFIDDWEGIERTELEKQFGAAAAYVGSRSNAGRISRLPNATKMRLYGLHKVAIEGPCFVAQPMALKVTARANWNAWQVLGNMTRETAMEQYIALLSSSVPAWIEDVEKDDEEVTLNPTDFVETLGIDNLSLPEELKPHVEVHGLIVAV